MSELLQYNIVLNRSIRLCRKRYAIVDTRNETTVTAVNNISSSRRVAVCSYSSSTKIEQNVNYWRKKKKNARENGRRGNEQCNNKYYDTDVCTECTVQCIQRHTHTYAQARARSHTHTFCVKSHTCTHTSNIHPSQSKQQQQQREQQQCRRPLTIRSINSKRTHNSLHVSLFFYKNKQKSMNGSLSSIPTTLCCCCGCCRR